MCVCVFMYMHRGDLELSLEHLSIIERIVGEPGQRRLYTLHPRYDERLHHLVRGSNCWTRLHSTKERAKTVSWWIPLDHLQDICAQGYLTDPTVRPYLGA